MKVYQTVSYYNGSFISTHNARKRLLIKEILINTQSTLPSSPDLFKQNNLILDNTYYYN